MATLVKTDHQVRVTWLGIVPTNKPKNSIRSGAQDGLTLDYGGVVGEAHYGQTRPACVRTTMMHDEGTEIRNVRQLSILSQEELDLIAGEIGVQALDPAQLGATLVISGVPDFTHVPPSSPLQAPSGLTLTIDMENLPCLWPAKEIEADHPGHGKGFKAAADGRRGVTAWAERPGTLALDDPLTLFVPTQRRWAV